MRRHLSHLTVLLQLALVARGVVPAASSTAGAQRMEQRFPQAVTSRALETFRADGLPRVRPDPCDGPILARILGGAIGGALVGAGVGLLFRAASSDERAPTTRFVIGGAVVGITVVLLPPPLGVGCPRRS